VGPRTGLGLCGKTRPHWDSIPGPTSPKRVVIPTELSRLTSSRYADNSLSYQEGKPGCWDRSFSKDRFWFTRSSKPVRTQTHAREFRRLRV